MKALLTILTVLLLAPVLVVIGIGLGPSILVVLFIGGIALMVIAPGWLADHATWHHSRHTRVRSQHG